MKILLQGTKQFEKLYDIKFCKPLVKIHANGFISVVVDWSPKKTCKESYRFKYVDLTHTSSGGSVYVKSKNFFNIRTASFRFEDERLNDELEKLEITPWFDVCIASETESESFEKDYDYLFFHNTKYGIICWFAPKGWEDWGNAKEFIQ